MQPFPVGPFKLAQVTEAASLGCVHTWRTGHRSFAVDMPESIEIVRARGAPGEEAIRRAMQKVGRQFEAFIRQHPSQWFHFEPLSRDAGERRRAPPRVADVPHVNRA